MKLIDAAKSKKKGFIRKLENYFSEYDFCFKDFQNQNINLLEIGVQKGGSLYMWKNYLNNPKLVGIDIDHSCKQFEEERIKIFIGDQENPEFLKEVEASEGPFDIIIDDGGHTMKQQLVSFNTLFPKIKDGGVYVIEDIHTSYWPQFGGRYGKSETAVGLLKQIIDDMHLWARKHPRAKILHTVKKRLTRLFNRFGVDISAYIRGVIRKEFEDSNVLGESIRAVYVADSICFIFKGKVNHHKVLEF